MRNYGRQISYETFNNFVKYAFEKGYKMQQFEGALNDTYIIHSRKEMGIKGVKRRDFIILFPKFQNPWSNTFHILLTDDEKKVRAFEKQFEEIDI